MSSYDNIYLEPNYFNGESRSDNQVGIEFLGRLFRCNWMPANMSSVISRYIAKWHAENGYFYIYHRFDDTLEFLREMNKKVGYYCNISISVGVKEDDKKLIKDIKNEGLVVDTITIDIAHFDSYLGLEMLGYIKKTLPDVKVIAGNVATGHAAIRAFYNGADAVKIGIANGAACTTFKKTGFGVPMVECIENVCRAIGDSYTQRDMVTKDIIVDGGVSHVGDIAKIVAIAKGNGFLKTPMVMMGKMFAGCIDSPAEFDSSGNFKYYFGSASIEQKQKTGVGLRNIEGEKIKIPCNRMTFSEMHSEIYHSVQSSISYGGGHNWECFKNVKYYKIK